MSDSRLLNSDEIDARARRLLIAWENARAVEKRAKEIAKDKGETLLGFHLQSISDSDEGLTVSLDDLNKLVNSVSEFINSVSQFLISSGNHPFICHNLTPFHSENTRKEVQP